MDRNRGSLERLLQGQGDGEPTREIAMADNQERHLWLQLIGDERFETIPLPASGSVIIGRSENCDIHLTSGAVSRQHVRLSIDATGLTLEDLGSSNGTVVREQRLSPNCPLQIGINEVAVLGEAVTILVKSLSVGAQPRRLWKHAYFESRLEDLCASAQRFEHGFALMHVVIERDQPDPPAHVILSDVLRDDDIISRYSPGAFELLLHDIHPQEAEHISKQISDTLEKHDIVVRIGVACRPHHGRDPDSLAEHARAQARKRLDDSQPEQKIILEDPRMHEIYQLIARVAQADIRVLLLGETGTGKEVIAKHVHESSARAKKPYLAINCAALPGDLLESELFGYERGAFTGAVKAKPGLLEAANGGTVFLDELGEMALTTQAKLLRVLEEQKVMRVGGLRARSIDVRFISATNSDIEDAISKGSFRKDLYFRLNGIQIEIPPLRERTQEIVALARYFLSRSCRESNRYPEPMLSREALATLRAYHWPGNIRQLRNVMQRAVLLCAEEAIGIQHLPDKLRVMATSNEQQAVQSSMTATMNLSGKYQLTEPRSRAMTASDARPSASGAGDSRSTERLLNESELSERERIIHALDACAGNQTRAAKMLSISRRTLINRLERYGIPRPQKK